MTKILFIHNTIMPYRIPFFSKIHNEYNIKFLFTDVQLSEEIYNRDVTSDIDQISCLNFSLSKGGSETPSFIGYLLSCDIDIFIDSFDRHGIITFIIAKLRKKKIILWSEEWDWKEKGLARRIFDPIYKKIVKSTDSILVPGIKHREYYISLGACPEKVFLMPNVSNICQKEEDLQNKEQIVNQLEIQDKKVILYVGRLVERKGVDYLIKGFAKFKAYNDNAILIIVGDGECSTKLKLLAKELDIIDSVFFQGYVDDDYLAAYYLLSNVCVAPSITHGIGDPWVFTVNEAMYFGRPVIASDAVGAAFDMIENGKNGYIIPERDSEAICQTLKKILDDPDVERRMGDYAKRTIHERFRYTNMVDGFCNAVEYVRRMQ